ncbi:Peptidase C39 family protein [uncultured archaeon]|nr:Peptidase C39 family protein [uncultured archaeon]
MAKTIKMPYFHQKTDYTCGPACLKMVLKFLGMGASEGALAKKANTVPQTGTNHIGLVKAAEDFHLKCYPHENSSISQIKKAVDNDTPPIIHFIEPSEEESHYAVVVGYDSKGLIFNDPWNGRKFKMGFEDFKQRWGVRNHEHSCRRWFVTFKRSD